MRKAAVLELNEEERRALQKVARARSSKGHEALRARTLLLAAEGQTNLQISNQVGLHYNAVGKTRARFVQERLGALQDRPRSGRKPTIAAEIKGRILERSDPTPAGLGPLERALDGRPPRRLEGHRPATLGQK